MNYLDDDIAQRSALLLHLVSRPSFTASHAIYAVGGSKSKTFDLKTIQLVESMKFGLDTHQAPTVDNCEKCLAIWTIVEKLPDLRNSKDLRTVQLKDFRDKKLVDVIRIAGLDESYARSSQGRYRKIDRYIKSKNEKQKAPPKSELPPSLVPRQISGLVPRPAPVSVIDIDNSPPDLVSLVSPLSVSTSEAESFNSRKQQQQQQLATKPSTTSSSQSAFSRITSIAEKRKSTKEKQDERELDAAWNDAYSAAYKVGSLLHSLNLESRLKIEKFNGKKSHIIASQVNDWFGCELLGGNEIKQCVKEDRVGQSPPRRGAPSRIPDAEFIAICHAVWSCQSLDQSNCDPNLLTRPEIRNITMEIINTKLVADGKEPLNEVKFFDRIQSYLAREVTLNIIDKREALRAHWLTHDNQNKHYEEWECLVVELEFARWADDDEEISKFGNVVFYPGMVRFIFHLISLSSIYIV